MEVNSIITYLTWNYLMVKKIHKYIYINITAERYFTFITLSRMKHDDLFTRGSHVSRHIVRGKYDFPRVNKSLSHFWKGYEYLIPCQT